MNAVQNLLLAVAAIAFVTWLLSFAIRVGLVAIGYAAGIKPGSGGILVFLGLTLLVQNLIVGWPAQRLAGGAPASVVS